MIKDAPTLFHRLTTNYIVSFLLWLVAVGLMVLDFLYGRLLIMGLFGLFPLNRWMMSFIDRAGVLILGLIALSLILYLEHYYRQGVERKQLWSRFARITVLQGIIVLAGLIFAWLTT
ncbi:MAG: hypothetical protein DYG89_28235 [Caldilinea sp. CFX5]|nr:hypothetical protein [Caldilinea sp. CFX5]